MSFLGIDIGGANLKASDESGDFRLVYLPMWKRFDELRDVLVDIRDEFRPDAVGIVMTAEISDVFSSKVEGVLKISSVVEDVFDNTLYMDLNGNLRRYDEVVRNPRGFMASNWVASVKFLISEGFDEFIFADMGSTTTDIIPVRGEILAGRSDYERLRRGELLYFGALRTPINFILREFDVPLASEYFSIAADAFVVTGDMGVEEYTCETPDGRGKDLESCMRRIARLVCSDLEEVGEDYVRSLAMQFKLTVISKLSAAMIRISKGYGLKRVVGCGVGEFLIRDAAERVGLEYLSISEMYGEVSKVFPSFALARLVKGFLENYIEKS